MRLSLSAARPAAAPGRAGGKRRRVQGCEETEELKYPTLERDWTEERPGRQRTERNVRQICCLSLFTKLSLLSKTLCLT